MASPLRVAILSDYHEEHWPSMDLVADMLSDHLRPSREIAAVQIRPRFVRRFSHLSGRCERALNNLDRLINRLIEYPRIVRARRKQFDLFHIVDHSYSHLVKAVHPVPAVVTCHDLDTFRCLTEPANEARSWLFRKMTRIAMGGFQSAYAVACDSVATRDEVLQHRLVPEERLSINQNGIAPIFSSQPDPDADREAAQHLGAARTEVPEIMHVGSTIARKRINVLLKIFAELRGELPSLRLVRVGGAFTSEQRELVRALKLPSDSIAVLPFLRSGVLAAIYRRAALTILPSSAEGFGFPVLESMACGTSVVASDLPVLREIGGTTTTYSAIDDISGWAATIGSLLRERRESPRRWSERSAVGAEWARQFTWNAYAERAAKLYRQLLAG
jgi:glycosyltransferase involved in cell wall biosynthesis